MPQPKLDSLIYIIVQSRGSLPWAKREVFQELDDKEIELVEETVTSEFARYIAKHM